ncbi:MAG: hypothetical protein AB1571_02560 [Nanoarchaeota archaeon]
MSTNIKERRKYEDLIKDIDPFEVSPEMISLMKKYKKEKTLKKIVKLKGLWKGHSISKKEFDKLRIEIWKEFSVTSSPPPS